MAVSILMNVRSPIVHICPHAKIYQDHMHVPVTLGSSHQKLVLFLIQPAAVRTGMNVMKLNWITKKYVMA